MKANSCIKFLAAIALALPSAPAWGAAGACDNSKGAINDCSAGDPQAKVPAASAGGAGIVGASSTTSTSTASCDTDNENDIDCLQDAKKPSAKYCTCQDQTANQACIKNIQSAIDNLTAQKITPTGSCGQAGDQAKKAADAASAQPNSNPSGKTPGSSSSSSGGSGMDSMMPLMMMGLGALAGYMIAKSMQNNNNNTATATNGTLQPDGSLNCAMSDSYNYPECDQYLMGSCASTNPGTLTTAASSQVPVGISIVPSGGVQVNCSAFNQRYCSTSVTPAQPLMDQLASGATEQMAVGGSGEGLGSQYCQTLMAGSFCAYPGRQTCPSCLQLQTTQSANCVANPAACVPQYSANQISAARSTCPMDPIFANPQNSYLGNSLAGSSLPTTLPYPGTTTTATLAGGAPAVLPQSSGLGGTTVATSYEARTTVSRGPASDVGGAYSASVFSSASEVIRQRCQSGRLNCP